jgi:hypothetical protein
LPKADERAVADRFFYVVEPIHERHLLLIGVRRDCAKLWLRRVIFVGNQYFTGHALRARIDPNLPVNFFLDEGKRTATSATNFGFSSVLGPTSGLPSL